MNAINAKEIGNEKKGSVKKSGHMKNIKQKKYISNQNKCK